MLSLSEIVSQGKLKTYSINKSFLDVYWHHPSLAENQYYLFVFTMSKYELVSVNKVLPKYIPVKHKPKVYNPIIINIMKQFREINS
jgi:hypothetical protein